MQKNHLAIIALFLWIFNPLSLFAQEIMLTPSLLVTEIAAFESSETEWIEIYNKSETPIDLTDWKFFEDETNHGLTAFRGDNSIDPGEFAVIANKADLLEQKYPEYTGSIFDSSWSSLKEEGEEIGIKDADGNFLERFIYPQTGSSTSLERIDLNLPPADINNWALHPLSNSMGKAREVPASVVAAGSTTVLIAEPVAPSEPVATTPEPPSAPPIVAAPPIVSPPPNQPPTAIIQIQSGSLVAEGETTINFDGRASFDPETDRLNFFWDFGDGTTSNSENPGFHKYSQPENYTITLTVTDPIGASGNAHEYVQVLNRATISAPAPMRPPLPPPPEPPKALPSPPRPLSAPPTISFIPSAGLLPQGVLELRGYFVFEQNSGNPASKEKTLRTALSSKSKKSPKSGKKALYKNGDLSNDIKITEISPNPAEAPQEWIEISNTGNQTVNLGNWMLADTKKILSPYLIPDSVNLKPGTYAVFQKGATHLSLNNGKDTVFLADFEGNVMDEVSYEGAKKAHSYAIIREGREMTWEWTKEATPGASNPIFEKIEGRVARVLAGNSPQDESEIDLQLANGESKKIRFTEETLDPLTAEVTMQTGTNVSLAAQKENDGTYTLKNVDEVHASTQPAEQTLADATKNSLMIWVAFFALALSLVTNGIPLIVALKKWRASRASPPPATTDFQKDETVKREIAEIEPPWSSPSPKIPEGAG